MKETFIVSLSKMRQIVTPTQKSLNVSNTLKNDAYSCKEWSTAEMIQCADIIIGKAVSGFDCQLPMSMKIGLFLNLITMYKFIFSIFSDHICFQKKNFNYFDISLLIS